MSKPKRDDFRGYYFRGYYDFFGARGIGRLTPQAQALALALATQLETRPNGSLMITASVLPSIWKSSDRRTKAKRELLEYGFIFEVKRGFQRPLNTAGGRVSAARQNVASLYALACEPLVANPQHDPELAAQFNETLWRVRLQERPPGGRRRNKRKPTSNAEESIAGSDAQCRGKYCADESMPSTALNEATQCRGKYCDPNPSMPPTCHLEVLYPYCEGADGVQGEVSR